MEYESAAAYAAAKRFGDCASQLSNIVSQAKRISLHLGSGELEGKTADKLRQALTALERDISSLQSQTSSVQASLVRYAREMEAIDREMRDAY